MTVARIVGPRLSLAQISKDSGLGSRRSLEIILNGAPSA